MLQAFYRFYRLFKLSGQNVFVNKFIYTNKIVIIKKNYNNLKLSIYSNL